MNKRLLEALELVKTWPDQRQEDAAYVLLAMQEQSETPFEFDDEDRRRLEHSLAQARRGEFATDEEVAAVRKKHGL
jgi:deoxyribodipyrimidine photolyase-like uncharacterized protein